MLKFVARTCHFKKYLPMCMMEILIDVRVKCRVGFKKPADAEPKDFVSVDLAENVGTIVN